MDINSQQFDVYNPYSILEDTELINRFKLRLQDIKQVNYSDSIDPICNKAMTPLLHFINVGTGVSALRLLSSINSFSWHIKEEELLRYMIRYSIKNRNHLADSASTVMLLSGVSAFDVAIVRLSSNGVFSFTKAFLKGVFTWSSENFVFSTWKDQLETVCYIPLRVTQTTLAFLLNIFLFDPLADFKQIVALSTQYTYCSDMNCNPSNCRELVVRRLSDFMNSTIAHESTIVGGMTIRAVYEDYGEYEKYCKKEYGQSNNTISDFFEPLHNNLIQEKRFYE